MNDPVPPAADGAPSPRSAPTVPHQLQRLRRRLRTAQALTALMAALGLLAIEADGWIAEHDHVLLELADEQNGAAADLVRLAPTGATSVREGDLSEVFAHLETRDAAIRARLDAGGVRTAALREAHEVTETRRRAFAQRAEVTPGTGADPDPGLAATHGAWLEALEAFDIELESSHTRHRDLFSWLLSALASGCLCAVGAQWWLMIRPALEGAVANARSSARREEEFAALAREHAENEQRLRVLVEGTSVVAWEYDAETERFTYVAPQIERYGYPLERWKRPGFWASIIHDDDREVARNYCATATARREDHRFQYRIVTPTGIHWVDDIVSVAEDASGRLILRGAFVDITAQKESERDLEEITDLMRVEAERLELALSGGDIGLWDWSPTTGALHVNARWARTVGVSLRELSGTTQDITSRVHLDDQGSVREAMERHLRGETEVYEALYRIQHADGHWVWVLSRGKVVARDARGAATRVVGTQFDRTAVVAREQELEALQKRAEDSNRTKSEFLANMSHEIRTPLTAILGFADMLRDDGDLRQAPERRVEMIDTIRGAGQHLLTVINDVLDLSKIEADRMTIEDVETDLPALLLEVARLVEPRALGKGLPLTIELCERVPTRVRTDPTRLRQILMNLLGNAVKFTEEGRVVLRVRRSEGERLVLEVDDSGAGMTEEEAQRLFQPFIQADGSVTRKFGGTGLGLTISRRLARLMGGEVRLERSAPGKGSCFVVEVPVHVVPGAKLVARLEEHEATPPTPRIAQEIRLKGRILLVEDGPMNQRLIQALLAKAGAEVVVADHGLHALAQLVELREEGESVDLIVSDMQMPEMDGYTLARTLRANGDTTPIVALTAHAMAEDRKRCLEAGCDDFATKPVDRVALLATCARFLNRTPASVPSVAAPTAA